MSADAPLAGTGFLRVPAPGPGTIRISFRLGISRPSEETLVLELGPEPPAGRPTSLASIHLPTATIERGDGESDVVVEVLNGRGETTPVLPSAPPIELEPGDTVLVAAAALALRYAPWADGEPADSGPGCGRMRPRQPAFGMPSPASARPTVLRNRSSTTSPSRCRRRSTT